MDRPVVALVGAYERDNFGDLLFAYVTEHFLSDFDVRLTAPLDGSVDHLLEHRVSDYRTVFDSAEEIDAVWTVGGQVGGVRPEAPLRHHPDRASLSTVGLESPYIPRMSQFRQTRDVPFFVNSSVLADLGDSLQNLRVVQALREADVISVRDRSSFKLLERFGIAATSAPDIVHAISTFVSAGPRHGSVIIQFAGGFLDDNQRNQFADWVATSSTINGENIVLWAAGVAPGHDSFDVYQKFIDRALETNPNLNVSLYTERHPLEIVKMISGAKLSISTSLHARIISSAYNIPRVSWARDKLVSYCGDWDYTMPSNLRLNNLEEVVSSALSGDDKGLAKRSTRLAEVNTRRLVDQLHLELEASPEDRLRRRVSHLSEYATNLQTFATRNS